MENTFYSCDARDGLARLLEQNITVDLAYLDPPYLTGKDFGAFSDQQSAQDYYAMMREILQGINKVLADTGSIFCHVDPRTSPRLRLMLDEIFGEDGFRNEIVWCYESGGRAVSHFSRKHDVILFYAKSEQSYFDAMQDALPRTSSRSNHMKRGVDKTGRSYASIQSHGKEYRYYDDEGVPASDVWTDISHLQQKDPERTGYPTQKPLRLLHRIIKTASRVGDTVLDVCAGSGTTLLAAAQLNRRFIGMDASKESLETVQMRLKDIPTKYISLI